MLNDFGFGWFWKHEWNEGIRKCFVPVFSKQEHIYIQI